MPKPSPSSLLFCMVILMDSRRIFMTILWHSLSVWAVVSVMAPVNASEVQMVLTAKD